MEEIATAGKAPEKSFQRWLFNPFYFVAGGQALLLGVGGIIVTGLIAFLGNTRFDGVLDFHMGGLPKLPIWVFVSEGLLSWLIMAVLLLTGGKMISSSRVRSLDVLGTQALARFPCLVTALFGLLPGARRFAQNLNANYLGSAQAVETCPLDGIMFGVSILVTLLMIIWMVALMYRAYAVSCNVSGRKAIGTFIVALLIGEAVSKVSLIYLI